MKQQTRLKLPTQPHYIKLHWCKDHFCCCTFSEKFVKLTKIKIPNNNSLSLIQNSMKTPGLLGIKIVVMEWYFHLPRGTMIDQVLSLNLKTINPYYTKKYICLIFKISGTLLTLVCPPNKIRCKILFDFNLFSVHVYCIATNQVKLILHTHHLLSRF